MKILVNAFASREGGGKWFTKALIVKLALTHPEWSFIVYCVDKSFASYLSVLPNIKIHEVEKAKRYLPRMWWQQYKFRGLVKREKIDVIFSPLSIGTFWPKVPQVTVQRNAFHFVRKVKKELGGQWLKKRSQLIGSLLSIMSSTENVFVSNYMLKMANNWIKEHKGNWHVIYNAVDVERLSTPAERLIKEPYFLYVGTLDPHKAIDSIVLAFKIYVRRTKTKNKLVLVGQSSTNKYRSYKSYGEYLKDIVAKEDLTEKVIFWGDDGGNIASLYKYSELCIFPSKLESFGIIAAEAMYAETPCIVSDIPVFHEIYGDAVKYFDSIAPDDMAAVIQEVDNDVDLKRELVNKGIAIRRNFDIELIAQQYSEILEKAYHSKK